MEALITPDNLSEFLQLVVSAVAAGKWASVAALVLVATVWALRKFIAPKVPFFATGEGGAVLTIATSFGGALATALLAGTAVSGGLILSSLQVALLAAGGWSLLKHLLPLLLRVPFLANLFARGDAAVAVTAAQKEGLAAAVAAKTPKAEDVANGP